MAELTFKVTQGAVASAAAAVADNAGSQMTARVSAEHTVTCSRLRLSPSYNRFTAVAPLRRSNSQ